MLKSYQINIILNNSNSLNMHFPGDRFPQQSECERKNMGYGFDSCLRAVCEYKIHK